MSDQRYLVTARKYRPTLFKELVAQEHVSDTLKNAIRLDRLAHAYLFSGPRGVGKTTAARILAKAVNCKTPRDEREDEAEPCRECDSCRAFEQGQSLSVFEFDAASNRKVDDIQPLLEKVRVPPQGGRKKVYIIDEVHMLSKHAFNAFLKTLEEPPSHALFIFATTEPHKVLPTILSRCQRFDFRRIPVPDVVERLRTICEAEGITADEESLMLIARKGDGALRDALSAFDQAVSLCGSTIEYGELAQAMGVVDLDIYFDLTDHVADRNSAGVLRLVDKVVRSGHDLQELLSGLAEHLRNLLVACTLEDLDLIEAASATRERYAAASQHFSENELLRLLMIAGDAEDELKNSPQPRLKLETALLRMAALTQSTDLREALQKIGRLEQMARDGDLPDAMPAAHDPASTASAAPSGDSGASSTAEEPKTAYEPAASSHTDPQPASASPSSEDTTPDETTGESADVSSEPESDAEEEMSEEFPTPEPLQEDDATDEPPPSSDEPDPPPSTPSESSTQEQTGEKESSKSGYRDLFGTPALKKNKPDTNGDAPQDSASEASPSGGGGDASVATAVAPDVTTATAGVEQLRSVWPMFVRSVKQERISLGASLEHTQPTSVQDGVVEVAVPNAFHRRQLRDQHRLLTQHLTNQADVPVEQLRFVVQSPSEDDASNGETPTESDPYERMQQLRRKHPVIDVLFEEFGGELVW